MRTKVFIIILFVISIANFACVKDLVFTGNMVDSYKELVINEVATNLDDLNPDWIEIYNPYNEEIDISGFGVYDSSPSHLFTFAKNTKIPAKGFFVIVCDANLASADPGNYASFGLSADGESVSLVDKAGIVIDQVNVPALSLGTSYARIPDGSKQLQITNPTKGIANSNINLAPVIEADTLLTGMIKDNMRFQYDIVVTDDSGIREVKLWLQSSTETYYLDMAPMGSGAYRLLLPLLSKGEISYYIVAVDETGLKTFFKPTEGNAFTLDVIAGQ
jgi:hypothetical protein